jgi:hypothetical protein
MAVPGRCMQSARFGGRPFAMLFLAIAGGTLGGFGASKVRNPARLLMLSFPGSI